MKNFVGSFLLVLYASFSQAQIKNDTLVGIMSFQLKTNCSGGGIGSFYNKVVLYNADSIMSDTVEIKTPTTSISKIVQPMSSIAFTLPRLESILQTFSNIDINCNFNAVPDPYNNGSINNPFLHKNIMVWLKKNNNTSIYVLDSAINGADTINGHIREQSLGIHQYEFGNHFKLAFFEECVFSIIAKEDSTPVDITMRVKDMRNSVVTNYAKKRLYLNKGDVLEYNSALVDGSGTEIVAPNVCKPVSVWQRAGCGGKDGYFYNYKNGLNGLGCNRSWGCGTITPQGNITSGSSSINFAHEPALTDADYEFVIPCKKPNEVNLIEIRALQNNTKVNIGADKHINLNKGQIYFDSVQNAYKITSNEPVIAKFYSAFNSIDVQPYTDYYPNPTYYNRWSQTPAFNFKRNSNNLWIYIPYKNPKKMLNMECILLKEDSLKINGIYLNPYYETHFDQYKSVSYQLDSGEYILSSKWGIQCRTYNFNYNYKDLLGAPTFYDSATIDHSSANGFFGREPVNGVLWEYIPVKIPHSIRLNTVLSRDLPDSAAYYAVCQNTNTDLWGRADFYTANKSFWLLPNNDSIKFFRGNYLFKDTGFFTIAFVTEKRDTQCDGSLGSTFDSTQIHVKVYAKPKVTLPNDTIVCKNSQQVFMAMAEKDTLLQWVLNDSVYTNLGLSNQFKIDNSSTVIARMQWAACSISADTMQVNVYDSLQVILPADTLLCYGANYKVIPTIQGGDSNSYRYLWSSSDTSKTFNQIIKNNQTLQFTITDACMAKDTASQHLSLLAPLHINHSDTLLACKGKSIVLKPMYDGGKRPYTFLWNNGTTDSFLSIAPLRDTLLSCILKDNCSQPDTQNVLVKLYSPLQWVGLTYDTVICNKNKHTIGVQFIGGKADENFITITTPSNKLYTSLITQDTIYSLDPESGNYQIRLENRCDNRTLDTTIFIKTFPQMMLSNTFPDTICFNSFPKYQYSFSAADTKVYLRKWFDNGLEKDSKFIQQGFDSIAFPFNLPTGKHNIKLTFENSCNYFEQQFSFEVRQNLQMQYIYDTTLCEGDIANFVINPREGKPPYQYQWQDISNQQIVGTNAIYTFKDKESKTMRFSLSDACSPTVSGDVKVNVIKKPLKTPVVYPLVGCEELTVFQETPDTAMNPGNYFWRLNFGNGFNNNLGFNNQQSFVYNKAGSYNLELTQVSADNKTCLNYKFPIQVYPTPKVEITSTPLQPEVNDPIIVNSPKTAASIWQWSINDTLHSTGSQLNFSSPRAGIYSIKLKATNDFGCSDSGVTSIEINEVYHGFVPNSFSPNGDGINDIWKPSLTSIKKADLIIFNRWGEIIYKASGEHINWDGNYVGNPVMAGMYYYTIQILTTKNKIEMITGNILLLN